MRSIPLGQVAGLEGDSVVPVDAPVPGQGFPTPADILFQWRGAADAASIVLALDAPVAYDSEVTVHAIWGAVRGTAADRTASVTDGHVIDNGNWLAGPGQVPTGRPLFFLAQLIRPYSLVGSSPLVPFIVGGSWPQPDTACVDPSSTSVDCVSPAQPMVCRSGVCRIVCGSQLDCPAGLGCGEFVGGTRVCE